MSVLSVNFTFSYWQGGVLGNSASTQDELEIGEWDTTKRLIRVHSNHSQSFDDFSIEMDVYSTLGTDFDTYFKFNSLDPLPKDHPGVDLSLYTFDNWYLPNGTIFTSSTVMNYSVDVYPSWNVNSSQFTYSKTGDLYNINNTAGFNLTGDLYIPGWRYKGCQINMLGSYSFKFTNYNFGGSLTIGSGIKKIYTTTFSNAAATSLTLEEGLEDIDTSAFNKFKALGDLIIPSTIKLIGQTAFSKSTFNGRLDISNTPRLKTTGTNAFDGIPFQGDLVIGPGLVSIKYGLFTNDPFNGVLDLSNASSLESIDTSAFQNCKITSIIFPTNPKLKSLGVSSFQGTSLVMTNLYIPKTMETINAQAFSSTKFNNIYIPLSVTYIGNSTFFGSTSATIYYEGSSIPETWMPNWNYHNRPVVFNAVF